VPYCPSATGTNTLALPYNLPAGITDVQALIADIQGAGGVVRNVQRFDESTDSFQDYPADGHANFALVPGEALLVQMDKGVDYRLEGSHDPTVTLSLEGPSHPESQGGVNFVALPHDSTASNALDVINQINDAAGAEVVDSVQRLNECTDEWEVYSRDPGQEPFKIVPGEGYIVKMNDTVSHFVPPHF
jgi:hypothetical protein